MQISVLGQVVLFALAFPSFFPYLAFLPCIRAVGFLRGSVLGVVGE